MEHDYNPTIRETIWSQRFANGMVAVVMPKVGYRKKSIRLGVKFGFATTGFKLTEKERFRTLPEGTAHMLEHVVLNGQKRRMNGGLGPLGAAVNGVTESAATIYGCDFTDDFLSAYRLLVDMVFEPRISLKSLSKERDIVGQEIKMNLDNPFWHADINARKAMFHRHPVRVCPLGTNETIREIDVGLLSTCHRYFYQPSNMIIVVVGDVVPEYVFAVCQEYVERKCIRYFTPPTIHVPLEPAPVRWREISREMPVPNPIVRLGFKDGAMSDESGKAHWRDIISRVLLEVVFGKESPLFHELYRDGLVDESFLHGYTRVGRFGFSLVGGRTVNSTALVDRVVAMIERVRKRGIRRGDLSLVRKRIMWGDSMQMFNRIEASCQYIMREMLDDNEPFGFVEILRSMDVADVERRCSEHFDGSRMVVSSITPGPRGTP